MRSALPVTLVALALFGASLAGAASTNPYTAASARMAEASSMRLDITFTIGIEGHSLSFSAHGIEFPRRHEAAMQVDMSRLEPSLGVFSELGFGHYVYLHVPEYRMLLGRDPRLKPWVSVRVSGAVSPSTGAAGLGDVRDIVPVGRALDDGAPVERYSGRLVLARALAADPELRALLARDAALRAPFEKPLAVRFDVGDDGYLRGAREGFTFPLPNGHSISIHITVGFSGFGASMRAIRPPARDEIMTYKQFQAQIGGAISLPVVI